jgi:membrane-bound serine protease (ClpP class)
MLGARSMRFLLALLALAAGFGPLRAGPAPAGGLTRVRIAGPLDVGTQAALKRAIDGARERGDRLLIELDTPGGEIELMWQLANALLDASAAGVGTAAWVHDRALSAGALLALACELVYMRSHSTLGSALPVQVGPGGLLPVAEDEEVREKLSSALRGEFRGVAEKRGRSGLLAEAMVDPEVEISEVQLESGTRLVSRKELEDLASRGEPHELVRTVVARGELLNVTGREAVELGLADGLAESFDELAAKLGLAGVVPTEVQRTRSDELAAWLHALSPLFLIAGFVLIYLELKTPGFGLPGSLALVSFGIVLFGRYLVGLADIPHVLLLVAGAALIALELFLMPGALWPGLLGAAAILFGLIWSFAGARIGLEYALDRAILIEESFRVVGAGLLALLVIWGLSRLLPHTPVLSHMVLAPTPVAPAGAMPEASGARAAVARVGAPGRALTALRPVGKVALDAAPELDFEARAEGAEIAAGARVRVLELAPSGRLVVGPEERAT